MIIGAPGCLMRDPMAKSSARKAAPTAKSKLASSPGPRPSAAGQAKWVYAFGGGKAEGRADMRDLLGGKGAGLAEMANLGLPVPPGFTITTEVCTAYYANARTYPKELAKQVDAALAEVGRITGKKFG